MNRRSFFGGLFAGIASAFGFGVLQEKKSTGNVFYPTKMGMNCHEWARQFIEHVKREPEIAQDEGAMRTWFASALLEGYDRGAKETAITRSDDVHLLIKNRAVTVNEVRGMFGLPPHPNGNGDILL